MDIRKAENMRDMFLDWASVLDELISLAPPQAHQEPRMNGFDGSVTKATEEAAIGFLASHEPATTRELFKALTPSVPIGGKNPLNTLSSRLSLSKRIKRDGAGWMRA